MPLVTEVHLREICLHIVRAMGAAQDIAEIVSDVLVRADSKGVDSHGCRLLYQLYMRQVGSGMIVPTARAEIIKQDGAATFVEGHWAFGHPAARLAAQQAIASARAFAIGAASLVHVSHIARLGEYVEMIAEQGMLGMVACHAGSATTPHGGMKRVFGTNPLALAVPRSGGKSLVADFATSARSANKLAILRQRRQKLPQDIILDKNGQPSTNPDDFFDGGMLLPVGGYKGYALSLFIEIIGGIMIGAGCSSLLHKHPGNGTLFIAMDIARWRSPDEFVAELEQLLAVVKAVPPAPGSAEVLLPGELEDRAEERRRREGIPFDDESWQELSALATKLGLPASLFA